MVTMTIAKKELPALERPLDYPACLDRIVLAAENRADYEIAVSKFERRLFEKAVMPNFFFMTGCKNVLNNTCLERRYSPLFPNGLLKEVTDNLPDTFTVSDIRSFVRGVANSE